MNESPPVNIMDRNSILTSGPPKVPVAMQSRTYQQITRPPLERASSEPERAGTTTARSSISSSRTSIDKSSSIDKSYNSKDGLGNTRERYVTASTVASTPHTTDSRDSSSGHVGRDKYDSAEGVWFEKLRKRTSADRVYNSRELLPTDENNVPQIDRAITPPASPIRESLANGKGFGIKRFASLKLKSNRMGSTRSYKDDDPDANTEHNPTITITMDEDRESIMSDYLSPDTNYKREARIHFIGDDVSLYGTPKEELSSPLKEGDCKASASTSYLKDQIISFFQPSDNKLAMKLFGNKNALMKEKMRQKAAGNWVIHPCSNFR